MSKSNLSQGPLFQDTMDFSRVVQPREDRGREKVCGIFWKTKNGALVYGGTAPVPASLFGGEDDVKRKAQLAHIGFVPFHGRDE